MSRAVSMRHTVAPAGDRDAFRALARRSKSHYEGAGCRYWLFEEESLPGAYVEFFEAADPDTLRVAHSGAPVEQRDAPRVYLQVELS